MKWKVSYSKEAKNFIETHNIWNESRNGIRKFFQKMKGEDVNINFSTPFADISRTSKAKRMGL